MAYGRVSRFSIPTFVLAGISTVAACGAPGSFPPSGTGTGGGGGVLPGRDASADDPRRACADPAWACWPMPNPPETGLPNPARYDKSMSEVVTDNVTELTWQRSVSATTFGWAAAKEQCANLTTNGALDWRLPTRIELVSLIDFTRASPAIDTDTFIGVAANLWTATPALGVSSPPVRAWQVSFSGGGATTMASEDFQGRVRCVRARLPVGEPKSRYRIEGTSPDEIVTDLGTGLVWQRNAGDATFTFDDAQTHCATLVLEGGGWRVPSVKELQTLVHDAKVQGPFIDTEAFTGTPAGRALFWTSSPSASEATAAWFVNFGTGEADHVALVTGEVKAEPNFVRCVR
jgi:hypothetical protein